MAKALKTAALIVGAVALVATGVGALASVGAIGAAAGSAAAAAGAITSASILATASTISMIAGAVGGILSLAGSALAGNPKGSVGGNATKFKIDKDAGIPIVFGRTYVGGNVIHRQYYGPKNVYESWVTALSIGPVHNVGPLLIDKNEVAFAGNAALGSYAGHMWLDTQSGACPETRALAGPFGAFAGWDANSKLSGVAADLWTMKFDSEGKVYPSGVPERGRVIEGVFCWDPRLDSSWPGGVGSSRINDPETHLYSQNPWLMALQFAYGFSQNGVLIAGGGLPITGIDVASFIDAANCADANGWTAGGIVYTTSDNGWDILKMLAQAGAGEVMAVGALLSCTFSAPRVSIGTITSDDIMGDMDVPSTASMRDRRNTIIPRVRLESHGWEMLPIDPVVVADYVTLDGGSRPIEVEFPLVQDADQGAVLGAYLMLDGRELDGIVLPCKIYMLGYRPGDCLTIDIPEADLIDRDVIVRTRELDASSLGVTLSCRSETPGKHAFALGQTGTAPPTPDLTIPTIDLSAPDAADWSLTGTALTDNGSSIPALHLTGSSSNPNADAVIFEYRVSGVTEWSAAGLEPPRSVDKVITSITPGTSYEVAVSYRVRGVSGDRLILGPVTAGDFAVPGGVQAAIANSFSIGGAPLAAADGTVTIYPALRRYPDGHADVAINGATISSGLSAGDLARIAYDDFDRAGGAVSYALYPADIDAHSSPEHPGRHYVGYVTIPTAGASAQLGFLVGPQGGDAALRTDLVSYATGKGAAQIAFTHGVPALPGTLAAKGQQEVNVDDAPFNAKGDGVTDDTDAIMDAIDEIARRGSGRVLFTSGKKYLVNSLGRYLEHAYPGIWLGVEAAGTATIINGSSSRYALTWGRTDMVTYGGGLHGLAFASAEGVLGSGVLIQRVGQFRVESNTFHTYPSKLDIGIKMVACSQFAFTANEMQGCKTAGAYFVNCIDGYIVVGRSDACEGSGYWLNGCQGFYCVSATAYNSGIGWKLQSDNPAIQPNQNNFFINCLGDTSFGYNWLIADSINSYFVSPWGSTQISPTENRGVSGFLITGKHSRHLFFTNPVALFNNGSGMQIYDPGGDAPTDIHITNPVCGSKGISGTPNGNGRGGWGGYGIDINGACDRIRITGGQFLLNASGPINNTSSGTDVIISGNPVGYLTSNQGLGSVAVGTSSVLIWHGLGSKPLAGNVGITDLSMRAASGISSTTISDINEYSFTVHTDANVAAQDFQFSWQARAKGT